MPASHIIIHELARLGIGYVSLLSYLKHANILFEEIISSDEATCCIDIALVKAEEFVPVMMKIGHSLHATEYRQIVIF